MTNQAETNKVIDIIEEDKYLHLLFWALLTVFLFLIDRTQASLLINLSKSIITTFFFALVVYVNWFVLIPSFLKKRKWLLYMFALVLWTIILTPLKTFAFYFLYLKYPDIHLSLLNNQDLFLFELFFVGAVSSAFKITQDWVQHDRDKKDLQRQQLQSELNFLKSQINPHFLFNTLNNLYALTLKKSDDAPEMVLRLSEMMRYMLYECNERQVLLANEIKYIENYLELERIRQRDDFKIKLSVSGIEANGLKIAPLIFIPFIENSFKHGMNNHLKGGYVDISLNIQEEGVQLHIENSKADHKREISKKKSGGIGLINIRRRLELLYSNKHELDIVENENLYKVDLNLRLN